MKNSRKYFVEFMGTFFLMFTIGCALFVSNTAAFAPIAIGFVLMVMVYAGGPISGGHYNPAVSLAVAVRGALPWKQLLPYWLAQLIGAGVAAIIVAELIPDTISIQVANFAFKGMIIAEFLFTFALSFVVLMTATREETQGNSYFGLAIGSTVSVGAFVVGAISLAAFNPAVVFGIGILGVAPYCLAATTVVTNLLAAIFAGLVFKFVTK